MRYEEEKEFTIRLVLRCSFPDDYDGDLDGYAWASDVPRIAAEVLRGALAAVGGRPGWKLHGGNRGRSTEDEVTLVLDRVLDGEGRT